MRHKHHTLAVHLVLITLGVGVGLQLMRMTPGSLINENETGVVQEDATIEEFQKSMRFREPGMLHFTGPDGVPGSMALHGEGEDSAEVTVTDQRVYVRQEGSVEVSDIRDGLVMYIPGDEGDREIAFTRVEEGQEERFVYTLTEPRESDHVVSVIVSTDMIILRGDLGDATEGTVTVQTDNGEPWITITRTDGDAVPVTATQNDTGDHSSARATVGDVTVEYTGPSDTDTVKVEVRTIPGHAAAFRFVFGEDEDVEVVANVIAEDERYALLVKASQIRELLTTGSSNPDQRFCILQSRAELSRSGI